MPQCHMLQYEDAHDDEDMQNDTKHNANTRWGHDATMDGKSKMTNKDKTKQWETKQSQNETHKMKPLGIEHD